MDSQILSKAELIALKKITKNFKQEDFDKNCEEVQTEDLKPLLSDGLYLDLLANKDTTGNIYENIIEPLEWTDTAGLKHKHYVLKYVLANFIYARILLDSGFEHTLYGSVQKNSEFSTASPEKTIARHSQAARNSAMTYWEGVKHYLKENTTIYTLYLCTTNTGNEIFNCQAIGGNNRKYRDKDYDNYLGY